METIIELQTVEHIVGNSILGVPKSTAKEVVELELGLKPILLNVLTSKINFSWRRQAQRPATHSDCIWICLRQSGDSEYTKTLTSSSKLMAFKPARSRYYQVNTLAPAINKINPAQVEWICKFLWAKLADVGFKAASRKLCYMVSLFGMIHKFRWYSPLAGSFSLKKVGLSRLVIVQVCSYQINSFWACLSVRELVSWSICHNFLSVTLSLKGWKFNIFQSLHNPPMNFKVINSICNAGKINRRSYLKIFAHDDV